MLQQLVEKFGKQTADLKDLRIVTLSLIAFAGFLRFNEVANIQRSHLQFHDAYCSIALPKSKTDVYRQGKSVLIARTGKVTCPVAMLERYLSKANITNNSTAMIF